jgi:hypothetical protein
MMVRILAACPPVGVLAERDCRIAIACANGCFGWIPAGPLEGQELSRPDIRLKAAS